MASFSSCSVFLGTEGSLGSALAKAFTPKGGHDADELISATVRVELKNNGCKEDTFQAACTLALEKAEEVSKNHPPTVFHEILSPASLAVAHGSKGYSFTLRDPRDYLLGQYKGLLEMEPFKESNISDIDPIPDDVAKLLTSQLRESYIMINHIMLTNLRKVSEQNDNTKLESVINTTRLTKSLLEKIGLVETDSGLFVHPTRTGSEGEITHTLYYIEEQAGSSEVKSIDSKALELSEEESLRTLRESKLNTLKLEGLKPLTDQEFESRNARIDEFEQQINKHTNLSREMKKAMIIYNIIITLAQDLNIYISHDHLGE